MFQLNRPNYIHYTIMNVPPPHRSGASSQSEAVPLCIDEFFGEAHEVLFSRPNPHNEAVSLDTDLTLRERSSRNGLYDSGYESDSIPSTPEISYMPTYIYSTNESAQHLHQTLPHSVNTSHRNSRAWPDLPTAGLAYTYFSDPTPTAPASTGDSHVHKYKGALNSHPPTPPAISSAATGSSNRNSTLSYTNHDQGGFGDLHIVNEVDEQHAWGTEVVMTPTPEDWEFVPEQEDAESVFEFDRSRPVGEVHRNMGSWLGRKVGRVFGRRG
jgi:hypothetical protein